MRIRWLVYRALLGASACCALCVAPVAQADLIGTDFAKGSQTFDVTAPTATNVPTGAFTGTYNGHPIIFFCFELTQYFSFGVSYPGYSAVNPSNAQFDLLSRLFTEAFAHALDSTQNSAAFQLAVWEILYDPSPTSLTSGAFHVTDDHGNSATVTAATNLLNNLPATGTYTITWLQSADNQDFIFGTQTLREAPEPSMLFLAGFGVAAMVLMLRRRINRQSIY